jgi:hypothetical protein
MLPSRREFVARYRRYTDAQPRFRPWRVLAGCLYFAPAFAYLALQECYLRERLSTGWYEVAQGVFLLLLVTPGFYLVWRFQQWDEQQVRSAGLKCPGCELRLTGILGSIAVASGRCGKCGQPVHSGDDPA